MLAENVLQNRIATITAIQSKYVHLYQNILKTWQIRFPELHDVHSMKVVTQEGNLDLAPIDKAIEGRNAYVQGLLDIYSKTPVPVHMFSEALGVTEIDSVAFLATTPKVGLRCCAGSVGERQAAFDSFERAEAVIIDLNAIGTLILLGIFDQLRHMPIRVVVAQETVNALLEMLLEQTGVVESESGVYTKMGSAFGFIPISREEKKSRAERLEQIVTFLREYCEVASCRDLSRMPPERRKELIGAFGLAGAQSIVLAKKSNRVLWTDDWTVATFANGLGVSRIWTQLVLASVTKEKTFMTKGKAAEAMAKLIGYGYEFTWTNELTLMAACKLSGWELSKWPLSQVLDQIRSDNIEMLPLLQIVACFIADLEKQGVLESKTRELVYMCLSRLANRKDRSHIFHILRRDLPKFVSARIGRISIQTIPAFVDWLSHYNAVSYRHV